MDIVKQRRKRLMAWILALVLCVGMWQGSVYATEGEGDGNDPVITEGSDESIEPQSVEPQNTEPDPNVPVVTNESGDGTSGALYNIEINLTWINGNEESNSTWLSEGDISDNWKKNNGSTWSIANSGNTYSTSAYEKEKLNLSDVYFTNGEYKHNVLNWKYESPTSDVGKNEWKEQNTGEVSVSNIVPIQSEEGNKYYLTAVLGKSVLVTFWESDASGNIKEDTSLGNSVNIAEGDETSSVTLPSVGSKNGFATGWRVEGSSDPIESEFTIEFDKISEFEEKIRVGAILSKTISSTGKFYLCPDTEYTLSSGEWKVDDGYTYSGGTFYISSEEREYSFSQ